LAGEAPAVAERHGDVSWMTTDEKTTPEEETTISGRRCHIAEEEEVEEEEEEETMFLSAETSLSHRSGPNRIRVALLHSGEVAEAEADSAEEMIILTIRVRTSIVVEKNILALLSAEEEEEAEEEEDEVAAEAELPMTRADSAMARCLRLKRRPRSRTPFFLSQS